MTGIGKPVKSPACDVLFSVFFKRYTMKLDLSAGTHYSVLRVPIWQDEWLNPLAQGLLLDFAVIWDEDHDARVMEAVETLYFSGLLSPVRFIGERKGSLSVLISDETARPIRITSADRSTCNGCGCGGRGIRGIGAPIGALAALRYKTSP
jgi:hypothetical protein